MPPVLHALLLDLDGTLIDSEPALRLAFERFLGAHGRAAAPGEYERYSGPPLAEIIFSLAAQHQLPGRVDDLVAEYHHLLESEYVQESPLATGAEALLELAARSGLRLAVVTSAPERLARPLLARLGVLDRLSTMVCGDQVARGKPSPEPYLAALERLAVAPHAALAIEDTTTGVRSARGAGLPCIGVGARSVELARAGALAVAEDLNEVREMVAGYQRHGGRVFPAQRLEVRLVERSEPPLPSEVERAVDREWQAARTERPQLVDGEMLSVQRVHRAADGAVVVEVGRARYRSFVAQRRGIPLGVRPLGVSGVTVVQAASAERSGIVIGLRGERVTQYPSAWELVPSGGLPPSRARADGTVDAEAQLCEELVEELGVACTAAPRALGLIEDLADGVLDLCYRLDVTAEHRQLSEHLARNDEYQRIELLPLVAPLGALAALGRKPAGDLALVPTVEPLLELLADHERVALKTMI